MTQSELLIKLSSVKDELKEQFGIEKTVNHFDNADDLKHDYLSWDSVIREYVRIVKKQN